jgi:hypothetical protein
MKNNERYIDQGAITIFIELNPKKDKRELKSLLEDIGSNDLGGGVVPFDKFTTLHFARWFLIEDAKVSDSKGQYMEEDKCPDTLAFCSNFDGDVKAHLQEILNHSRAAIIKIYSYCKGFPSGDTVPDEVILDYLMKHSKKNQLFWPAIRGGTVEQLKGESLLRSEVQNFMTTAIHNNQLKGKTPEEIKLAIIEFVKNDHRLRWAMTPRSKPSFGWYFRYYGILFTKLLALIPVGLLLGIWWVLSGIYNKRDNKYRKPIVREEGFEELLRNEDRIFMNQLTVYGGIKRPYWFRRTQLKLGLWIFSLNGKYRSNKGKLSGIETIHFARWALFNNGKNVTFLSNYDGAWEIYLSEFIDRSAEAMNLTFGTTVGYPKVKGLLGEGAHDEQAFKTVVRNNQYPCQVWYSAYPRLTVKNILNNHAIRQGIDGSSKESTEEWLKRF